jgi:hypothetical protein
MQESKPRTGRAKAPFTLEAARAEVLAKMSKAGAKGATSPVTAKTQEPKRSLYGQALDALEAESAIYVDRSKAKPKYFACEHAPSVPRAAGKMEQLAARQHPALLTAPELKKALNANEKTLAAKAVESLEADRRLVKLIRKTSSVYAHGDSLRAMLGAGLQAEVPLAKVSGGAVRQSYENLVRLTGFPDVEIAALQRQSGVSMAALKDWLLAEHRAGRAIFGLGDWSLADEATRAGVIDLRGDRYLLVRLEGQP